MRVDNIEQTITPEDIELNKKLQQLSLLETELIEGELDSATLQADLHAFEAKYIRIVGACYAELDEIEALIAEANARLKPKDNKIQEGVFQARAQARASAQAIGAMKETNEAKFVPSEDLKKLYRELAKCIHPDLATDEKERARCQQLMVQANVAYEKGDSEKLKAILVEWANSPESVKGDGIAAELVRVIRKIAQVEERLRKIYIEIAQLEKSELFQLKEKVEFAEKQGRDLLFEMALIIKKEIDLARNHLDEIQ